MTIPLLAAEPPGIAAAVEALRAGRLILHPTETLVSLTGDPYRHDAAESARSVKGYSDPRPFLCLVPDPRAARELAAEWPEAADRLAASFWPGPLTLVVLAAGGAPSAVAAGGRIALRYEAHPVARALLAAWAGPLFSTSANRRGHPAPVRVADAATALGGVGDANPVALGLVPVDEPPVESPFGQEALPSTIVDVSGAPRVVRSGAIPAERLREVVPELT